MIFKLDSSRIILFNILIIYVNVDLSWLEFRSCILYKICTIKFKESWCIDNNVSCHLISKFYTLDIMKVILNGSEKSRIVSWVSSEQ